MENIRIPAGTSGGHSLLEPELCKPAASLYLHNLTSTLETAVRATNAQYDPPDVLARLDVKLFELSPEDTGWDVFTLTYCRVACGILVCYCLCMCSSGGTLVRTRGFPCHHVSVSVCVRDLPCSCGSGGQFIHAENTSIPALKLIDSV